MAARTTDEILTVLESEADIMDIISLSVAVDALFDALRNDAYVCWIFYKENIMDI